MATSLSAAQLLNKANCFYQNTNGIDIVIDAYQENSLKNHTRESKGSGEGTWTYVRHDTPIQHKKFKYFLRGNDNQTELFQKVEVVTSKCEEDIVICTRDDKVLANRQITISNLEPCNHEKADSRLFVQV